MHERMYRKYLERSFSITVSERQGDFIKTAELIAHDTGKTIPVRNYIPRFSGDDYCESFGLQWSTFKSVQLDSASGHRHSQDRFISCTKWDVRRLWGASLLECGCGPGRFTEIFLNAGADVVSVDMSGAVDVNRDNNGLRDNFLLLQCDITALPFFQERFDYVFCYGVLQHTPNPRLTFEAITGYLAPGGRLSVDIYRKLFIPIWWTTPKYLWRPLTKRMDKTKLLNIIKWYIPRYIGIDTAIKRIPLAGAILAGLVPVPCWNYLARGYTRSERTQHAIMDTFDALSPAHDHPKTLREVRRWFSAHGQLTEGEVFAGANGVVGNARKTQVIGNA